MSESQGGKRRLDLRQQRMLSDVIARAQKEPGLHIKQARNGWTYTASRSSIGTIRWNVNDASGKRVTFGECP